MSVHDFDEQLGYSHNQADAPYWQEVYRQAFPDMIHTLDLRQDGWHQRAGRDRAVILASGRSIFIDEKVRRREYDDLLVEIWSRYPLSGEPPYKPCNGSTRGWGAEPKDCDFLAYAFERSQICYLLPFLGVRAAWSKHGRMWIDKASAKEGGYRWIEAQNRTYKTISIAVPTRILQDCVNDALTICWAS